MMTTEKAIEELGSAINILNMVAESHGCSFENHEPIEKAIKALETCDKYRWHDLKKNQNDLPALIDGRVSEDVMVCYVLYDEKVYNTSYAYNDGYGVDWCVDGEVIAWKYIEYFEGDKT